MLEPEVMKVLMWSVESIVIVITVLYLRSTLAMSNIDMSPLQLSSWLCEVSAEYLQCCWSNEIAMKEKTIFHINCSTVTHHVTLSGRHLGPQFGNWYAGKRHNTNRVTTQAIIDDTGIDVLGADKCGYAQLRNGRARRSGANTNSLNRISYKKFNGNMSYGRLINVAQRVVELFNQVCATLGDGLELEHDLDTLINDRQFIELADLVHRTEGILDKFQITQYLDMCASQLSMKWQVVGAIVIANDAELYQQFIGIPLDDVVLKGAAAALANDRPVPQPRITNDIDSTSSAFTMRPVGEVRNIIGHDDRVIDKKEPIRSTVLAPHRGKLTVTRIRSKNKYRRIMPNDTHCVIKSEKPKCQSAEVIEGYVLMEQVVSSRGNVIVDWLRQMIDGHGSIKKYREGIG